VSGFILPGNHRSSTYAITYDAEYSEDYRPSDGVSAESKVVFPDLMGDCPAENTFPRNKHAINLTSR
jgi:hypothetical protein